MDRNTIKNFWNCGDSDIINLAKERAGLNKNEKLVVHLLLDECMTQEQAAEEMEISVRHFQKIWYSATDKMMRIPWVITLANN